MVFKICLRYCVGFLSSMAVKTVLCLWVALQFASSLNLQEMENSKDVDNFPLHHFKNRQGLLFKRFDYEDVDKFPLRHFQNRQGLLFKRKGYDHRIYQPLLLKRGHPLTIHMPPTNQNEMEDENDVALQEDNDGSFNYEYLRPIFLTKKHRPMFLAKRDINDDYLRYFRNRLWNI